MVIAHSSDESLKQDWRRALAAESGNCGLVHFEPRKDSPRLSSLSRGLPTVLPTPRAIRERGADSISVGPAGAQTIERARLTFN